MKFLDILSFFSRMLIQANNYRFIFTCFSRRNNKIKYEFVYLVDSIKSTENFINFEEILSEEGFHLPLSRRIPQVLKSI